MSNKIKEIFSDDMFNLGGTLRFSDDEAYKKFLAALEIVYNEGRVVSVDGVTSVATVVNHQGEKFPLDEQRNISRFYVGPAIEAVSIPLDVDGEKKAITLLRSRTKEKVFLRSEPDSVVAFDFCFLLGENRQTVNYKVQFEKAKTITEVAESFSLASALLAHLYKQEDYKNPENGKVSLTDVKEFFCRNKSFFKRLCLIENEFSLAISPNLLSDISPEEQQDIDELYLLLFEKKVIRLNAKLTSTDLATVDMKLYDTLPDINSNIALVFTSTVDFSFLKQTVRLYSANFVVNALVKEIHKGSKATKILYGDTDSKPMYISYSAYKTEGEAEHETGRIMNRKEEYINAPTEVECIRQMYANETR